MSPRTVVVDGSNIATEGRQMPSLLQLDEAVRAYREEHADDEIIVVVDATFAHRIPDEERPLFEEAAAHNELVYPPAGAIGRGDAFLLRIAEKTGAIVLSNDSFQEFHGEHDWLFDKGRLVGGTPVPGVGWIFVARTPVRGPKSREAVKEAKRSRARVGSKEASLPMPVPKAPPPRKPSSPKAAIAEATEEAVGDVLVEEKGGKKKRRRKRRGGGGGGEAAPVAAVAGARPVADLPTLNEPLTFIEFIAEHKLGSKVDGTVDAFSSHGAFVLVGDTRCYIPLSAMGDPAPRSAREVLKKGDTVTFVVQALDAARRGVELALPGFEHVAGAPTEETVEAEIEEAPKVKKGRGGRKKGKAEKAEKKLAEPVAVPDIQMVFEEPSHEEPARPTKRAAATKKAATTATKKTAAKKAPAKKAATTAKKAGAPAKKGAATKTAAAPKKAATKAAAKKSATAPAPVKKAPAKKVAATKKSAASTKKVAATPVKKAAVSVKKAAASPVKKAATVKKTAAKKSAAKKASAAKK